MFLSTRQSLFRTVITSPLALRASQSRYTAVLQKVATFQNPSRRPIDNISFLTYCKKSSTGNMKEAIIYKGTNVKIVDSPIPKPGKGQVVIKVVYSGSNPKDWYV